MENKLFWALLYLCFLFRTLTTLTAAGGPPPPYNPPDNIALDCGSATDTNATDGRIWTSDSNSKYLLPNPSTTSAAIRSTSSIDPVPYSTARLSRSQFTYSFPLTTGPKFVRLYFYPASYTGFSASTAYFSVTAGRYTFLSNFSAALNAQALGLEGFAREFCLNVEEHDRMLNITFTPSLGVADAYAFINGIEIVSTPTNLYYSAADDQGFQLVGGGNLFRIESRMALQLMYRLDVGATDVSLSPQLDTGMFRSWSRDNEYLTDEGPWPNQSPITSTNMTLSFTKISNYSAPEKVYKTARSMGPNKTINNHYNLTWGFQVHSAFTYLVRLHFCEFVIPLITKQGDRVFQIIIANQTAERHADVIEWSGGNGIPVYKDYAVEIGAKGNQKVQNLSIALHTSPESLTAYSDAVLNGIEIFKLSNSDNLAVPDPNPTSITLPVGPNSTKRGTNRTTIFAVVGGAVSGVIALSLLLFLIFQRRLKVKDHISTDGSSWWGPFSVSSTKTATTNGSPLPSDLCRHFSLTEIKAATNNFDDVFIIGVGGFGSVYKGYINGGAATVAIKRLNPESKQGANEFKTEIELLSQLRHLHLVSLIGYCNENHEMILVYDYMSRGTLRDHLYNSDNPPISWKQRLQICIGAAQGLLYLHSGANQTIIHRDVKTTNILLDEKWVAKVSDFGLSKIGPTNMSKAHVSTVVKGSFGYLDPEYYRLQQLTEKSDVYSFGVVLFEVLCARPAVDRLASKKVVNLAELARQRYRNGTINQIIDPHLHGKIAPECLQKFVEVAVRCLEDRGIQRPSMGDVVWGLEFALQLQESAGQLDGAFADQIFVDLESPMKGPSSADDSNDLFSDGSAPLIDSRITGITITSSSDEQSFISSNNSEKMKSGAVFSELMNPTGR